MKIAISLDLRFMKLKFHFYHFLIDFSRRDVETDFGRIRLSQQYLEALIILVIFLFFG
jgi:hypothetical protein